MRKKHALFIIFGLMLLTIGSVAYAGVTINISSGFFWGKIANTKAERIEELENEGYTCNVPGSTIEIQRTKTPYSFMIPYGTHNASGFPDRDGQHIVGRYKGTETIICTLDEDPEVTETVQLDKITLYATSKI
jgi:hypothetical protein